MESIVIHAEKVTRLFGYWPQFCDTRVISLSISRLINKIHLLTTTLSYIDAQKNIAADIELTFVGVSDLNIGNFMDDNILDELSVVFPVIGESLEVNIEACYGLSGTFKCEQIEVTSLKVLSS